MQSENSPESLVAVTHLQSTSECILDRTSSSPRLMHAFFNYRSYIDHKRYYHSFVGEIACGRWAISRLRKYLWGYYVTGCAIKITSKQF